MDSLRRWRQPVAVALLVACGVRVLVGTVAVPVLASEQAYGSLAIAALFEAGSVADLLLLLATAAAAAWCSMAPPTRGSRVILVVAVVELGTAVIVSVGFGLLGLTTSEVGRYVLFAQLLASSVLPALAAGLLLGLLRTAPATAAIAPSPPTAPMALAPPPTTAPVPAPPAVLPPSWASDQATGVAWQTAGDAAAGHPPTGWSAPAETAGWQPIPGPPGPLGPSGQAGQAGQPGQPGADRPA